MKAPLGLLPPRRVEYRRPSRAVQRRRRPMLLAVLGPLLKAMVVVGLPVATVLWLLASPRFALRQLEVRTDERIDVGWAHSALEPLLGRNLFRLALVDVERRLSGHDWVSAVQVRKQLPDALVVQIEARRPAAVARTAERRMYVDEKGLSIAPVADDEEPELLVIRCQEIEVVSSRGALLAARELTWAWPQWGLALSEVEVLGMDDFRLHTAAIPFPLTVRPETTRQGVRHLARVLSGIEARLGVPAAVDLRYPQRIVVEPAASPAGAAATSVET